MTHLGFLVCRIFVTVVVLLTEGSLPPFRGGLVTVDVLPLVL